MKELKIDESKYFVEKDSNAFEDYYVRWDGCSFINLDSMVKGKNL
ncbi:hypothetical protein EfmAA290_30080 (plasmid) [Enterococcus faecium]|nr:hypothetical protein EfmAA290_30080 [Enterococcus faecium]